MDTNTIKPPPGFILEEDNIPPPPNGFVLEDNIPAPPEGFVLEEPTFEQEAVTAADQWLAPQNVRGLPGQFQGGAGSVKRPPEFAGPEKKHFFPSIPEEGPPYPGLSQSDILKTAQGVMSGTAILPLEPTEDVRFSMKQRPPYGFAPGRGLDIEGFGVAPKDKYQDIIANIGLSEIGKSVREMVAPTTPYTEKETRQAFEEIPRALENIGVRVLTLGGLAGPLMGLKPSQLRAAIDEDAKEGITSGLAPALAPANADTIILAVQWGYIYPKLFAAVGTAGKVISKIPQVAKATEALKAMGGIEKIAEKYPRLVNVAENAVKSFTKGAAVGTVKALPEALGEELPAGDAIRHIGKDAAIMGGVATVFALASEYDTRGWVNQYRKTRLDAHKAKFDNTITGIDNQIRQIQSLPDTPENAQFRAQELRKLKNATSSLGSQKIRDLKRIDKEVAVREAQLRRMKADKLYKQGQELIEKPDIAAHRAIESLKIGLGETKPAIQMPTTRVGEAIETVKEIGKAVLHPVKTVRKAGIPEKPPLYTQPVPTAKLPPVTIQQRQQAIDFVRKTLSGEAYASLDNVAKAEIGVKMLAKYGVEAEPEEIVPIVSVEKPPQIPITQAVTTDRKTRKRKLALAMLDAEETEEGAREAFRSAGYTEIDGFMVDPDVDPEFVQQLSPKVKTEMKKRGIVYIEQHSPSAAGAMAKYQNGKMGIRGVFVRTGGGFSAESYSLKDEHVLHEIGHHIWQDDLTDAQRKAFSEGPRQTEHGKKIASGDKMGQAFYTAENAAEEDYAQLFAENFLSVPTEKPPVDLTKTLSPEGMARYEAMMKAQEVYIPEKGELAEMQKPAGILEITPAKPVEALKQEVGPETAQGEIAAPAKLEVAEGKVAGEALAEKQPYQMTLDEYKKIHPEEGQLAITSHQAYLRQAVQEGKDISSEVLKDYPDLAKGIEQHKAIQEIRAKESLAKPVPAEAEKGEETKTKESITLRPADQSQFLHWSRLGDDSDASPKVQAFLQKLKKHAGTEIISDTASGTTWKGKIDNETIKELREYAQKKYDKSLERFPDGSGYGTVAAKSMLEVLVEYPDLVEQVPAKVKEEISKSVYTSTPEEWHVEVDLYSWGKKGLRARGNRKIGNRKTFIWESEYEKVPVRLQEMKKILDALRSRTNEIFKVHNRKGEDYYIAPPQVIKEVKAELGEDAFIQNPKPERSPLQKINDVINREKRIKELDDAQIGAIIEGFAKELGLTEADFSANIKKYIEALNNDPEADTIRQSFREGMEQAVQPSEEEIEERLGIQEQNLTGDIGGGVGRIEVSMEPAGKVQTATEIIAYIERAFNIPMRGVATHRKHYAGWFDPKAVGIRMKDVRALTTAMHEIGHHIDWTINNRMSKNPPSADMASELMSLGRVLYGPTKPPGGYKSEGFAEFIREYLTGDEAKTKAPAVYKWFAEDYLPAHADIDKKLNIIKKMITGWRLQGAEARIESQISRKKIKGSIAERLERGSLWAETMFRNELAPILRGMEKMGIKESEVRPDENPYQIAVARADKAGAVARHFVLEYTTDLSGNRNGKGLREILKPFAKDIKTFTQWIVAARARLLHKKGINPGISAADADYVYEKYDNPQWQETLKEVTEWNHRLLDYLVEAGGMEKEARDTIVAANPIYVPFMRAFREGELNFGQGAGKGVAKTSKAVKKIKGSGREVIDPFESMIQQAAKIIGVAHKTEVAVALAKLADKKGSASMIWRVPAPTQATRFEAEQLKKEIARIAYEKMGLDPEEISSAMNERWDEVLTVYSNASHYYGKDNIISFVIDGKQRFYEVNPSLYRAIQGLDQYTLPWVIDLTLGKAARTVRLGATGLNPAFGLIRNFLRDAMTFTVLSKHAKAGPLSSVKGIAEDVFRTEKAQKFKALGGKMSAQLLADRRSLQHLKKNVLASTISGKTIYTVSHPVDALRELFGVTEAGTRIGEFGPALEDAEKKYGKGSKAAAIYALNQAQDVTTNFSRHGKVAKVLNQIIPFFNAAIQGPDKILRTFADRPAATTLKAIAALMIPAIWMWWRSKDEEWYKNMPVYERVNYLHFQIPGTDKIIRIPVPFELGHIFQSAPVAALDAMYRKDPKIVNEMFSEVIKQSNPFDWPAAISPVIDILANRDFADRPIVPMGVEYKLPEDQYKVYTSKLMILIGKTINYSPAKLEHLVNSYSGGLYVRVNKTIDLTNKKEITASDIPIIGTLFMPESYAPKAQLERFYTERDELNRKSASKKITAPENQKRKRYNSAADKIGELLKKLQEAGTQGEKIRLYGRIKILLKQAGVGGATTTTARQQPTGTVPRSDLLEGLPTLEELLAR